MTQSIHDADDVLMTTNQDYGSFYSGRLQRAQTNPEEIALELALNDKVRQERRQLPSIAYDVLFDKRDSLKIVSHSKRKYKPVISRRQLKYQQSNNKTNEERQLTIKDAVKSYTTFIKCIYASNAEENPHLSETMVKLLANELLLLHPDIPADELTENMVAITIPHQYLGMPSIDPHKPYPGTEIDCGKTPNVQHLLEQFQTAKEMVADCKQRFDSNAVNSQPMEGVKYIYNPFTDGMRSRRI